MDKEKNGRTHEEDIDLTGMINAYRQDDELHRKIEEMKKQKEQEKNKAQENVNPLTGENYHSSIFTQDKEEPKHEEKPEVSDDKTLVIMNGKKSLSAQEENTIVMTRNVEEETFESRADEGEDATVVMNDGINFEDIPQEEEEEIEENTEKTKKMNKAITYGILGVFVVLLLVGGFFGVRYALDSFLGSDDSKTEEKTTDKGEETTTEEDDKDKGASDIQDNSSKIASLKQQKETYEEQLETANSRLKEAKSKKTDAENDVKSLESEKVKVQNAEKEANAYYSDNAMAQKKVDLDAKEKAYKTAQTDFQNGTIDKATFLEAQKAYNDAKSVYDKHYQTYQKLVDTAANLSTNYQEKKQAADKALSEAESDVLKYQKQVEDLTSKIKDIDKQLNELQ